MNDTQAVYDALLELQRGGRPAALATVIRTIGSVPRRPGSKMLVHDDGSIVGTVGGGAMEARVVEAALEIMRTGQPDTFTYSLTDLGAGDPGICGGTVEVFIEAVGLRPTVVVIGCGHVGKALAKLAKWSGFRVVVSDDRAELCSPQAMPDMDAYLPVSPTELVSHLEFNAHTFVAAVTRGLPIDVQLFPPLLENEVPYIGLIGSRRRWELTRKALIEEYNIAEAIVDRIHSPIGLDIHAETPQEIAVSIMAQIIAHYRG